MLRLCERLLYQEEGRTTVYSCLCMASEPSEVCHSGVHGQMAMSITHLHAHTAAANPRMPAAKRYTPGARWPMPACKHTPGPCLLCSGQKRLEELPLAWQWEVLLLALASQAMLCCCCFWGLEQGWPALLGAAGGLAAAALLQRQRPQALQGC